MKKFIFSILLGLAFFGCSKNEVVKTEDTSKFIKNIKKRITAFGGLDK